MNDDFTRDLLFESLEARGVAGGDLAHLGPDFRLRHDPNAIWSVETSVRVTNALEGTLEYMEDPTWGMEGMAEVRKHVNVPLSTNMCLTAFSHFPEGIRLVAAMTPLTVRMLVRDVVGPWSLRIVPCALAAMLAGWAFVRPGLAVA